MALKKTQESREKIEAIFEQCLKNAPQSSPALEPIRPLVGTIDEALSYFKQRGFTTVNEIENFYANPVDKEGATATNYVRYVYTEEKGWIDLRHYFATIQMNEFVMDAAEITQCAAGYGSCYSYEDLPSNDFGSHAPVWNVKEKWHKEPEGPWVKDYSLEKKTGSELFDSVKKHFDEAGATSPEQAPNYDKLPQRERPKVPDINFYLPTSFGSIPIPFSSEEKRKLIETGNYVPQNFSEEPYDLNKFPTPGLSYR